MTRVVVVGDVLLDVDLVGRVDRVAPDAPVPVLADPVRHARPGGAGLAALLLARDGAEVVLATALADDPAAVEVRALLEAAGVQVVAVARAAATTVKVRLATGGQCLLRLDRDARAVDEGDAAALRDAVAAADSVLASDYGRGTLALAPVRAALERVVGRVPVVWDPHPSGAVPVPGVRLVTPNRREAALFADRLPGGEGARPPVAVGLAGDIAHAEGLLTAWRAAGVAVTRGAEGAVLVGPDRDVLAVPAPPAPTHGDPCGAGDRLAGAVALELGRGALPSEAVPRAVAAATAFVASGGVRALAPTATAPARAPAATAPAPPPAATAPAPPAEGRAAASTPEELIARVRADGGTVVATGGCFDLLHTGHVRLLTAARGLGDCLVVLVNDDASVARLKGPERPVVPIADRVELLRSLSVVDAVVPFAEDTPTATLDRLRPDLWVKGGDYRAGDLPEAALLDQWGGRAVVVPYLEGHSTTDLIGQIRRQGPAGAPGARPSP